MALGNEPRTKKIYLSISRGQIVRTTQGGKEFFNFVEGKVEDIYSKVRNFNGTDARFWYVDIQDDEALYSICVPYESGVFVSIILSLASSENIASSLVRIEPYIGSNDYTKVRVLEDGVKLPWITADLPPVEDVRVGNKIVKDNSKRMAYIEYLVDSVKKRLGK